MTGSLEQKNELKEERPPPWSISQQSLSKELLPRTIPDALESILNSHADQQLQFLIDTRPIHKELFEALTPPGYEAYAGTYRGENGSILETRRTAIFYKNVEGLKSRNPALSPERVHEFMARLESYIQQTWRGDYSQEEYFQRSVRIFGDFNIIHPYLDGNGHVSRMMLTVLAKHRGIEISPAWSIHPRPYGTTIGICLQNYKDHSVLLEQFLKKWFKVSC